MKKFTLLILSILCVFACAIGLVACGGDSETLLFSEYQYKVNGEIIAEGYSVKAANTGISGEITIPDTYNGKPVLAIDYQGFKDCSKITTITVPEGVLKLLTDAFCGCPSTIINLPSTINYLGYSGSFRQYGKEINYNGTYADWKNIEMERAPSTTVHLTNGDLVNNQFTAK